MNWPGKSQTAPRTLARGTRAPGKPRSVSRTWTFAALLIMVLLLACGSPLPTLAPTAAPTPAEGSSWVVTLADGGRAIILGVGDRFLLDLGEGYDWTVTVADPAVVSRVVNVTVIRGAQGVYEAHMAGSTTLTAMGDPVCRKAQPPCEAPSRLFEIGITVHQ